MNVESASDETKSAGACPRCRRPIAAGAPKGLCAPCLVASLMDVFDGDDSSPDDTAMPAPANLSERVGNYELLGQLGRGGMGVVFRARDLRLHRVVALKLILTGKLASDLEVKRFRAEAEAAAQLEHPNIVPIYEVGDAEGRHYFAMKLVEGGSLLGKALGDPASGGWTLQTIASTVAKTARAVHYAHQRGILHRDLKPGNILLDTAGEPLVTDFGLARRLEEDSSLTLSGTIVGSPSFMAPEQARGRAAEITTAADIYSLGAILYCLLAGRPPFVAETALETMRLALEQEPSPPSRWLAERGALATERNSSAFRDLETISLKCLEKDPARRYASAAELADDMERWLRGEPILARPGGWWERAVKWTRRRPATAALFAVSIIALAGFISMQFVNEARLRRERDVARQQEQAAQQSAAAARSSEAAMRLNLYASDMFLAARALEQGNLALARRTLSAHIPKPGDDDLRGFEWRHYWHLARGQQERVLGGFPGGVNCIAYSPDGCWLAAGSGSLALVWETTNFNLVATFRHNPKSIINSVAFPPDGSSLSTGDQMGQVRVWVKGLDRPVGEISRGSNWVCLATPASGAGTVAIGERNGLEGGAQGSVSVYSFLDFLQRNERGNVLPKSGGLAAYSRDGQWLVTGGGGDRVMLRNMRTGEARDLRGYTELLIALTIAPDGQRVATSPSNGYGLNLYDVRPGGGIVAVTTSWRCRTLAYSPDGEQLAAACYDHTVRLLNSRSGNTTRRLDGHGDLVSAVAFSPEGRTLASASRDGTVRLWDLAAIDRDKLEGVFPPYALSADNRTLIHASLDDWTSSIVQRDLTAPDATPEKLYKPMPDRFPYVSRHHNGLIRWRYFGGDTDAQWKAMENFVRKATNRLNRPWDSGRTPSDDDYANIRVRGVSATSPDGRVLALGDKEKVRLWNNHRSARLPDLRPTPRVTEHIGFSPTGDLIACASGVSNVVAVYDTASGSNLFRLPPRPKGLHDLVFSPDGKTVALLGDDTTVELRNARTGELGATLAGHDTAVVAAAFSPDGRTLATAAAAQTKLWHLPTLREVGTLGSGADTLTFSEDGSLLVKTYWTGQAVLLRGSMPTP